MEPSAEASQPSGPEQPERRRRWLPAVGAAAVLAVLIAAIVWTASDSRDPGAAPSSPASPSADTGDSLVVGGRLELRDGVAYPNGFANASAGTSCFGSGGYDDISGGAPVAVRVDGKTVALGRLADGKVDGYRCTFAFLIQDVPAGLGFYTIEVSHRGGLTYTEADLRSPVVVTLG